MFMLVLCQTRGFRWIFISVWHLDWSVVFGGLNAVKGFWRAICSTKRLNHSNGFDASLTLSTRNLDGNDKLSRESTSTGRSFPVVSMQGWLSHNNVQPPYKAIEYIARYQVCIPFRPPKTKRAAEMSTHIKSRLWHSTNINSRNLPCQVPRAEKWR